MQLLETNGIDLQLPKENEKLTLKKTANHISEYLEYYKYELVDLYLCEYLHKEVQWYCDEFCELSLDVTVTFHGNMINCELRNRKTGTLVLFLVKGRIEIGS